MADLNFKISQNIIIGTNTINKLSNNLKAFGNKFMIVMDPILKNVGLQEKITKPLTERDVEFFVDENITAGANTKEIEMALELARQGRIHGVVAVGGKKTLAFGAAVASLVNETRSIYDFVDGAFPETDGVPLVCVPTTMRSTFAFTQFVPIIDSRSKMTKLLKIQDGLCRLVLWDSEMCSTLKDTQKEAIALEVLGLAIESYISQKASFFSDMFAEKAFSLLKILMCEDESDGISASATPKDVLLMQAGALASIATASSAIGVANLLALTLNSRHGIAHSVFASILLPFVIEDAKYFKADRIEKIAKIMHLSKDGASKEEICDEFAGFVRSRLQKAGVPMALKDLKLNFDNLALAAEDAGSLEIASTLPRSMNTDALFDFLKKAF